MTVKKGLTVILSHYYNNTCTGTFEQNKFKIILSKNDKNLPPLKDFRTVEAEEGVETEEGRFFSLLYGTGMYGTSNEYWITTTAATSFRTK